MQKSFCGRLPEEECVGKEILVPLAVFFVMAYSMYAVGVSFVLLCEFAFGNNNAF